MSTILIDLNGNIENISSSCVLMLHLDLKKLSKDKYNVTSLITDFFENLAKYENKNGSFTFC